MTSGLVFWLVFVPSWFAAWLIADGVKRKREQRRSWSWGLQTLGAIYEKQGGGR